MLYRDHSNVVQQLQPSVNRSTPIPPSPHALHTLEGVLGVLLQDKKMAGYVENFAMLTIRLLCLGSQFALQDMLPHSGCFYTDTPTMGDAQVLGVPLLSNSLGILTILSVTVARSGDHLHRCRQATKL